MTAHTVTVNAFTLNTPEEGPQVAQLLRRQAGIVGITHNAYVLCAAFVCTDDCLPATPPATLLTAYDTAYTSYGLPPFITEPRDFDWVLPQCEAIARSWLTRCQCGQRASSLSSCDDCSMWHPDRRPYRRRWADLDLREHVDLALRPQGAVL